MKKEVIAKSLFDYSDYRSYLSNYAKEMKLHKKSWSLGSWSKQLGLANTASLSRVIKGDRAPGDELVEKLVSYFGFNQRHAEYFRHLVNMDKQKNNVAVRMLLMDRLKSLHPQKAFIEVDHQVFQSISQWYCSFLRELMNLKSPYRTLVQDPESLVQSVPFALSQREITEAISILSELNLVKKDPETGQYTATDVAVDTKPDLTSEGVRIYFERNLDNAKVAIRKVETLDREFFSLSFCMQKSRIAEAKEAIREFRSEFLKKFEAVPDSADQVYQFQVQLFPYLKNINKNNKE